jgi:hypothetical protein
LIEKLLAQFRVTHLPAPEHDCDFDLVALTEKLRHLSSLGIEVADADLGPVFHLLDAAAGCLAPRLFSPLGLVELELSEVHDPGDRRIGIGCHLHQVQVQLASNSERFGKRLDPKLNPVRIDKANLSCPYTVVDPVLVTVGCRGYEAHSFTFGPKTKKRRASGSNARHRRSNDPTHQLMAGWGLGPASLIRFSP